MKTLFKWTVANYHRAMDAGIFTYRRVELLQGELVEIAPERPIHASTFRKTFRYLQQLMSGRADVFPATPIDLTTTNSELEPDLAIVQLPLERYNDRHPTPAEIYWVVEISNSTLQYDLAEKAAIYALANLQEYWVIDVQTPALWVHRYPEKNGYSLRECLTEGVVFPLSFPHIEIPVEQLLDLI